jgi:hypothetical protein
VHKDETVISRSLLSHMDKLIVAQVEHLLWLKF